MSGLAADLTVHRVEHPALAPFEPQGRQPPRGIGARVDPDPRPANLDALGDVRLAADLVGVHPNTFRYRLRRLGALAGIDLDDPVERLVAHLQLHLGAP